MIIYVFYDEQFYYRERVCITSRLDFVIDISVFELCIFLVLIKFTYFFLRSLFRLLYYIIIIYQKWWMVLFKRCMDYKTNEPISVFVVVLDSQSASLFGVSCRPISVPVCGIVSLYLQHGDPEARSGSQHWVAEKHSPAILRGQIQWQPVTYTQQNH